jgi:trk system potassium uptake protein TrkH
VQSLFEATSGFSTTGLSVVDVSTAPHIFLLHRSLMLFLGGVGLILVFTSILSDRYGMRLYNSEGHSDKLVPNLVRSSRLILSIYIGYILMGTTLYCVFGMDFFDAINHAIAAVSTGGFSTKAESIGYYNSVPIEVITMVLMLLGNTNFFVHLYLVRGKIKNVLQNNETKFLFLLFVLIIPLLFWTLIKTGDYSFFNALRISFFQFVSAITTTGFQTVNSFTPLPTIFNLFMILLMIVGAGIGSTGGGMKQQRVVIALKSIGWNIREHLQNKRILTTHFINKVGTKTVVDVKEQLDTFSFLALYLLIFLGGTLVFMAYGYSLLDSMFEFASSLGTVGLSVGITGFGAPPVIHITAIIGMFFGRLEIYVILYALLKGPSSFRNRDEIR